MYTTDRSVKYIVPHQGGMDLSASDELYKMFSGNCKYALRTRVYDMFISHRLTISNKEKMEPESPKGDPALTIAGWEKGYSFKRFWGNCYALLGESARLDGIQQLCHQYYLQNGLLDAKITAGRIRELLRYGTVT